MSSKGPRGHGRSIGVRVALGLCCAALAGGAVLLWEFGGILENHADGDPGAGSYVQDPQAADRAAEALLDGVVREVPAPPGQRAQGGQDGYTAQAGQAAQAGNAAADWRSGGWRPSEPLAAQTIAAEPAVGALFSPGEDGDGDHHCSGVVVHSPGGDLVATAAHCVYRGALGFRTNLVFVPGYRDGEAPYGVWVPTRIDVDPSWSEDQDPDHDVAFLRLRRPGRPGERLEDTTGAETIRFRPQLPAPARVVGYPGGAEEPVDCYNTARADGPTQLRLDCADVPDGTSGGPVLTDAHTLIGVVGGRDGGGDETTSFSSWFDDDIRKLYQRAVTGRTSADPGRR